MDDQALYTRWQEMFSELIYELDDKYDPRDIYEHSMPTFFRKAIDLVEDPEALEMGVSRLEWLPDLPGDMEWPHYEGKAMDFLAQINLAELDPNLHPLLPNSGWLYFFVGDYWNQPVIPHRVLYFAGPVSELARTAPPANLEQPSQLCEDTALITFEPYFSLDPSFMDQAFGWGYSDDPNQIPLPDIKFPIMKCQAEITRLGGYMYGFQGGGHDRQAILYLNGFDTLVRYRILNIPPIFRSEEAKQQYYWEREQKIIDAGDMERTQAQVERYSGIHKNLREETAPIEMLFGLESTMGRCWVDVGFLQFFIRQDDLEKRNFDNTFCDIIST
jgi:hypothetical protein